MDNTTTLPKGIRFFNKYDNAPEFVIGTVIVSLNELVTFCKENPALLTEYNNQKQLKLQLLKSKDGKIYFKVDTFKPASGNTAPANDEKLPF